MLGRVHATSLFIGVLLEGCGQGPAPAGEFPGNRGVCYDSALFAGVEDFPFVVEPVVAFQGADPCFWGDQVQLPYQSHPGPGVGAPVQPRRLDEELASVFAAGLCDRALVPGLS